MKAIIFDVDGVIMDSVDCHGKYLWSRDIKQDLGMTSAHFKHIFSEQWDEVTRGRLDTKAHLNSVLDNFTDLKINAERFISYWLAHDNFVNHALIDFVRTIDIPVYLGTNQDFYRSAHIKDLVGRYFAHLFCSYELGYLKTEKGFFHLVEKSLNLAPAEILLVDDTQANLEVARECGWQTYYYQGLDGLVSFINKRGE